MTQAKKTCGTCKWWTPTVRDVVGECELDMETKMREHQACVWFKERVR